MEYKLGPRVHMVEGGDNRQHSVGMRWLRWSAMRTMWCWCMMR